MSVTVIGGHRSHSKEKDWGIVAAGGKQSDAVTREEANIRLKAGMGDLEATVKRFGEARPSDASKLALKALIECRCTIEAPVANTSAEHTGTLTNGMNPDEAPVQASAPRAAPAA